MHSLTRPKLLRGLSSVMVAGTMAAAFLAAAPATARPPHVVFILADDLGFGDVGFTSQFEIQPGAGGKPYTFNPPRTPNLDAMALSESSLLFKQFYAGAPVCSPTRASLLTGRSPTRDCIDTAEGCGQQPAWSCFDDLPLPPPTYTVAEAAKLANYSTIFVGKWHLGNFWVKDGDDRKTPADKRWPASHPGMHGFDEWHATEASAESSTTNCGCVEDWKAEGDGCIIGGGYWTHNQSLDCTNYWSYANTTANGYAPSDTPLDKLGGELPADCTDATEVPRSCVANLTTKIEGDDSTFILGRFEEFLAKRQANNDERPVMAWLHIHTNHVPHFALPQWYHAYKDNLGNWSGDYLGTISQMDAALGTYLPLLEKYGIANDTLTFFSADNGAHTDGRSGGQNSASLGLRQCKASLFQGGILEPSFAHWPAGVKEHTVVRHATSTLDILATFEELAGVTGSNPHPTWAQDGVSIASLLKGEVGPNTSRPVLLPFTQGGQWAIINQTDDGKTWKIVQYPQKGQCDEFLPPYGDQKDPCKDGCLFEIEADPTESNDICDSEPALCATMRNALDAFKASVKNSQVNETQCAVPPAGPTPSPTPPSAGSFFKDAASGKCLTVATFDVHGLPVLGSCDGGSKWVLGAKNRLQNADTTGNCLKLDQDHYPGCGLNVPVWTGVCETTDTAGISFDASTGRVQSIACANMCVGRGNQATGDLVTMDCSDDAALILKQE